MRKDRYNWTYKSTFPEMRQFLYCEIFILKGWKGSPIICFNNSYGYEDERILLALKTSDLVIEKPNDAETISIYTNVFFFRTWILNIIRGRLDTNVWTRKKFRIFSRSAKQNSANQFQTILTLNIFFCLRFISFSK